MTNRTLLSTVLPILAIFLAGCAVPHSGLIDPTEPPALATEATAPAIAASPTAAEAAGPLTQEAEAASERAVMVLAAGLGVSTEAITFGEVKPVDWPDASLGCPLPGMAYAEVTTPGYRVTLTAAGIEYAVHLDTAGTAIVCSPDGSPLPGSIPILPGERILDGKPWMPVN